MLVPPTALGKLYFGEDNRGRDMNNILCKMGYQISRKPKRGYDFTDKGRNFCKKMEVGKLYWHTDIIPVLTKETQ